MKKIRLLFACPILLPIIYWTLIGSGHKFPAFVNPYDPELAGINCDSDCAVLANSYEWQPSDYGRLASCPPRFMGCTVVFRNDFSETGPHLCYDTGSAMERPRYVPKLGHVAEFFDILWDLTDENGEMIPTDQLPWWNHAVFEDWEADCTHAYR